MTKVEKDTIEMLAISHWNYTEKIMKLMYLEAFKHGGKHYIDITNSQNWRFIPNTNKKYAVSDQGNILSFQNYGNEPFRLLKKYINRYGYEYVGININNKPKKIKVHRAVLLSFIGKPLNNLYQCRHLDGNRKNNYLTNLCWGTPDGCIQDIKKFRNWVEVK